ncbi:glycosyltransferase family 4 protein, partial [Photorhabdus aegyptia]|uniref:glycosyltransferase family 4 protein n=1 Tax=Photorhabdus aegyptia TaxID=2805098 RepID=UPI001E4F3733
ILSTNSYHIDFVKKHYFSNNEIAIGDVSFFLLPNNVNLSENAKFDVGDKIKTFALGRMNYLGNNQKGFTDLIYSIKSLNQKILERYEITIVGQGNMKPYLTSLCTELTNITFIDSLPHKEIIKSLEESDLIILPSRYEGLSMFALEGLATGNACIFSKTGGLMDMIHTNGIFFEPQNIESLSNALIEFSNKSKEEISNMKKASLDICKKKYSKDAIQKKFHLIYEIIANKKNHKHDI